MSDDLTGGKNWMDNLKGPTLDYNNIFEEDTGMDPGVFVWQIDNFYPVLQDDTLHGKFYTGDCYIILHSIVENHDLKHQIYFWIGQESSLDKKACAAMHAVNLRNMLNAMCFVEGRWAMLFCMPLSSYCMYIRDSSRSVAR